MSDGLELLRIVTARYVAAVVLRDGVVREAAPILRRARDKTLDEVREIIDRRGWTAAIVRPPA